MQHARVFQGRSAEAEEMFSQRSSDRPPKADNRSRIISFEAEQLLCVFHIISRIIIVIILMEWIS